MWFVDCFKSNNNILAKHLANEIFLMLPSNMAFLASTAHRIPMSNRRMEKFHCTSSIHFYLIMAFLLIKSHFFPRPTFKTATPTSRTQLKQQLQREQLQELERQELERQENERKLSIINNNGVDGAPSNQGSDQIHSQHHQQSLHQLQVPQINYDGSNSSVFMSSSPTPSTSTGGSDYAAHPQYPNPSAHHSHPPTAPLKVPIHIDLPPQVLKVTIAFNKRFLSPKNWLRISRFDFRCKQFWLIQHVTTSSRSRRTRCDNI